MLDFTHEWKGGLFSGCKNLQLYVQKAADIFDGLLLWHLFNLTNCTRFSVSLSFIASVCQKCLSSIRTPALFISRCDVAIIVC